MEQVVLEASRRQAAGKGAARDMRREGLIPGVVYGLGKPVINLSVTRDEIEHALGRQRGGNVLFDLKVEGVEDEADTAALIKELQRHPISRVPESIDFQWVSLKHKVTVSVPIVLEGALHEESLGVVIDQILYEVDVSCLPLEIPERLVISIEGMELHETRTAQMLQVPQGIELLAEPDDPVVTCTPPTKVEEEPREGEELEGELAELEEGEEPEEGVEGEEAPEEAEEGEEEPGEET